MARPRRLAPVIAAGTLAAIGAAHVARAAGSSWPFADRRRLARAVDGVDADQFGAAGAIAVGGRRRIDGRLRSLALVELRTGDGRPGPLDRPGTKAGCPACVLERFLRPMSVRLHERLRRLGIRHVWDDYGAGTHDWPYRRRDLRETLPDMMGVLAAR